MIERNTTIPTSKSQVFSTYADNQPSVEIHVLQGEREMAAGNKTLGRFMLGDIPPAPRGVPQIEVSFDIDANGIVNVSATDKGTNKTQKITITSSSGLSDAEVEQMMKDAELHAEEDKKRKELVEAKNSADQLIYSVDKTIKDLGEKADAGEVEKANAAKELTEIVQQLSVKLYEQAQAQEQAAQGAEEQQGSAKRDNVVDADYEVVDEDKK